MPTWNLRLSLSVQGRLSSGGGDSGAAMITFLMESVATTMLCVFMTDEEIRNASGSSSSADSRMGIRCKSKSMPVMSPYFWLSFRTASLMSIGLCSGATVFQPNSSKACL